MLAIAAALLGFTPALQPHRSSLTTPRRSALLTPTMAGFGGGGKAKAAPKKGAKNSPVSARKQWTSWSKLTDGGAESTKVFARDGKLDADEWLFVGQVAVGKEASLEQGLQFQKRLILEHATRMSPRLAIAKASLEMGVQGSGDEVAASAKPASMPEAVVCGFVGEPDAGGFYSKGNRNAKDMAAKGAAPAADSKGRIGGKN